jgi:hypothetical protein
MLLGIENVAVTSTVTLLSNQYRKNFVRGR